MLSLKLKHITNQYPTTFVVMDSIEERGDGTFVLEPEY